jgi:hypothetical protein
MATKLPNKRQLREVRVQAQMMADQEKDDLERAAREKAEQEANDKKLRIQTRADKIIEQIPSIILSAVSHLKHETEVIATECMPERTTRWDDETEAVADLVVNYFKDEALYTFEKTQLDYGYNDSRPTADGGQSDQFWVNLIVPGIKITWKE